MHFKIWLWVLLLSSSSITSQIKHGLRDELGRHLIARGFVVNTNDHKGEVFFNSNDYQRMVRMGANTQVVRLELGKLSTFDDGNLDPIYLKKLDSLVMLGRNVGIQTIFKLTVYGVKGFSWEAFWKNRKNEQKTYIDAWKAIWKRYAHNKWVLGYDVVNEPRKLTMDISYDALTKNYLIPLYQKIIDECQKIGPDKKILLQSIFMNKGEAIDNNQYAEIATPINRDNIIFAPHIYQNKIDYIKPVMDRFDTESELLKAPILIGEWGFPTFATTDTLTSGRLGQLEYRELYIKTAEVFDRMGVGSIKAWFLGNRSMQNFLPGGPSTWAIFSDQTDAGTVERKYITDVIARPFPQVIAGDIHSFFFDFATRTLDLELQSDNNKGASRIFVGADRHYPDGFSILINDDFVLYHDPLKKMGLEVFKSPMNANPDDFIWDDYNQQLIVLKWPANNSKLHIKITPGLRNFEATE
ncbi:cellulase family glycosylhydrolase [Pseudozobellia thermophila]|uniref:Cellulase (Glycosyl hydrolase family 5) n=1 Tax=Pseudozobellia thermophila TaxID=192903 RepID=A0A1M6HL69_9FLAO|nr:cellulase family glycosylhydrolase [Pseudozobellia thermophila]SHJ22926.1 Cellulase (glycosyl hydrolase family 5) [Pseudozobellia thermophila]